MRQQARQIARDHDKAVRKAARLQQQAARQAARQQQRAGRRRQVQSQPAPEIYHIVINPNQANLNRRLETFSYCRHLKKYLLSKAQFFYIKGGALLLKSGR